MKASGRKAATLRRPAALRNNDRRLGPHPRRRFLRLAGGAAVLPAVSRAAWAQAYPARPVRVIVPYAAGGPTDIIARLMAQWLSAQLGQQFIIDNRPGAGTNIGTEAVVRAPSDGYTLLVHDAASAINATLYDKLNFNFIRDIAPVGGIVRLPYIVVVHPSVRAKTVAELVAYARANPGKINIASAGTGSPSHISGVLFQKMTGVSMTHVPYRGAGPATTDLLGGQSNAPHFFPRSADDMRTFAMPASRNLDRGSVGEAA